MRPPRPLPPLERRVYLRPKAAAHALFGGLVLLAACRGEPQGWLPSDEQAPVLWYWDGDQDGYGIDSDWTSEDRDSCEGGGSFHCVPRAGDCDDHDARVHPWASEVCDGDDNDCDGLVDDADDGVLYAGACFADQDGDGYGLWPPAFNACDCGAGYGPGDGDCDDLDAGVHPGAEERCDGWDDDCDGQIDELGAADAPTWYPDRDADGWGDEWHPWPACEAPSGFIATGSDCDDTDPEVNPGAADVPYDGVDADCDGWDDDDADHDGYPAEARGGTDCDDADIRVHPGAAEVCDSIDNDCDGEVDIDAIDASSWYWDLDGDGWGAGAAVAEGCAGPAGTVTQDGDCDEEDPDVHPEAPDCDEDGVDDDCDGVVDDDAALDAAGAMALGAAGDALGTAVAFAGDLEGGGQQALLLGMPGHGDGGGALLLGADGTLLATLTASTAGSLLGQGVAGPGDLDGDGVADLALGDGAASSTAGVVYLAGGASRGDLTLDLATASTALCGEAAGDRAAFPHSAGDFDADGAADLLISAPGESTLGSGAGAVYLVAGPVSGVRSLSLANTKLMGAAAGDGASAVAVLGDTDGDGNSDLLVGAWGADGAGSNSGEACLFLGPVWGTADLSSADALLPGEAPQDMAGWSVGAPGDVDGDGYTDLLVGAVGEDTGGASAGAAYLVRGPVAVFSLAEADAVIYGEAAGDWAGTRVDGAGDLAGDGGTWLLVGAPGADTGGAEGGVVALFAAPVHGSLRLAEADARLIGAAGAGVGEVLDAGRDHDGDGAMDLLLGAPDLDGGAAWLWTAVR
ncbi:MAG: MopE-related protein [Pseudomonadota bacterium]